MSEIEKLKAEADVSGVRVRIPRDDGKGFKWYYPGNKKPVFIGKTKHFTLFVMRDK